MRRREQETLFSGMPRAAAVSFCVLLAFCVEEYRIISESEGCAMVICGSK
jgi:hypothetical protein